MYNSYINYAQNITQHNISTINFKSNNNYNGILEHVSNEQGKEYIDLINETITSVFPEISIEDIKGYLILNDKYGDPKKHTFILSDNSTVRCSPTSLRYVYHSLLILHYYKFRNNKLDIVEVGCGYGGLFLAINHFAPILNISIGHYYFIDLPEICDLINNYISAHRDMINISYSTHSAFKYGSEIDKTDLFLISNYCFTEIEQKHRDKYIEILFPKVMHGFIVWQTIFGLPIAYTSMLYKQIYKIEEESPQTATVMQKNHFVYF